MSDGTAGSGFAELLRELKDRSGLSYGMLAKRLHMSTSTLHRYCNGDAVPADYAPVERLARLCKAGPEELVELHRRWVLADAERGRKPEPVAAAAEPESPAEAAGAAGAEAAAVAAAVEEEPVVEVVAAPVGERRRRFPRPALLAGIAVAAVLGAAALVVRLPSGGTDDKSEGPAGAATSVTGAPHTPAVTPSGTPSTSAPSSSAPSSSVSASATGRSKGADTAGSAPSADTGTASPPLTVNTQPYSWESPCSQHYLIDRAPADVAPPPLETDATAWVSAHGAVSSGEQYLTLTVQGTGTESVVLQSLTVRTVTRSSPLAWNDYAMGYPGVGCGGGVPTRSFTVALDAMRPSVVPEAGHQNFPFKVSESDPEVLYVKADASAYSVGWYLELSWSSGSRHGTLRIDDKGRPFRTSGNNGRPAYEFPLGGEAWRAASSTG
ncbi:helix-turn-helix transcriptional regulator [Streptomyces sp. NPDC048277]|uniref:helix-turn-helix domain-containing protein n=1 Tax=Streptomyces sp. NPDC048277 TaxID=3155027 RepID=UPI0033E85167